MPRNCHWCDRELKRTWSGVNNHPLRQTRDHVIPKSKGGKELVWSCFQCNNLKGDMMPEQWTAFMFANPNWWEKQPSTKRRGPVPMHLVFAAFEVQNQVRKDIQKLEKIEWLWLRENIRPRVTSCGFGP